MYRRVRDLCSKFPKTARPQSALDNVATRLFKPAGNDIFLHSPHRFTTGADEMTSLKSSVVPEFDSYGPNEKFLVNKIINGPDQLLYITGGIGVGKTSFLRFFRSKVLPVLVHERHPRQQFCPRVVYFNFNEEMQPGFDKIEIQPLVLEKLCTRMAAALGNTFFNLEQEIETVWEDMLREDHPDLPTNHAIEYIRVRTRDLEAETVHLLEHRVETLNRRKRIRQEIQENRVMRSEYIAALVRYVKERRFSGHPCCFLLIVDNVDIRPPLEQHALRAVLQPFVLHSGIKTVITARENTYYQRFDGPASVPADRVTYRGARPWDVVNRRLQELTEHTADFSEDLTSDAVHKLAESARTIQRVFAHSAVRDLFEDLCGDSVRTGLVLGQRLVANSVFNPLTLGETGRSERLRIGEVARALLVGEDATFSWSAKSRIENVYQVDARDTESYFIKLRILACLLDGDKPHRVQLGMMIELLHGFNYSLGLINAALNEMMLHQKYLIWSDSVLEFQGEEDLIRQAHSELSISPTGIGYGLRLFRRLEYIQEIMLDTTVDSEGMGTGWDYSRLDDRFRLVQAFARRLFEEDRREMRVFCSKFGPADYLKAFRTRGLLSLEVLETLREDIGRILGESTPQASDFVHEHLAVYDDLIIQARNAESDYLKLMRGAA